jgi:RNA polymerase sigma-70 factor, ECF subfamily
MLLHQPFAIFQRVLRRARDWATRHYLSDAGGFGKLCPRYDGAAQIAIRQDAFEFSAYTIGNHRQSSHASILHELRSCLRCIRRRAPNQIPRHDLFNEHVCPPHSNRPHHEPIDAYFLHASVWRRCDWDHSHYNSGELVCRRDESEFTNAVGRFAQRSADMMSLEPATRPLSQTAASVKQSEIQVRSSSEELERTAIDYSSPLYRTAFRQLGNHEDVEDAVQDALASAFCHLSQFEGHSQMSTWLVRIVINAARMKLRKRPRQAALSIDEMGSQQGDTVSDQSPDARQGPGESYRETELRELLNAQPKCLSPTFRDAVQLVYLDGFNGQEAAQALSITQSALKSRVSRARPQVASNLSR